MQEILCSTSALPGVGLLCPAITGLGWVPSLRDNMLIAAPSPNPQCHVPEFRNQCVIPSQTGKEALAADS